MARWLENWLQRHRHPVSLGLHILAIPMLPAAGVLLILQLRSGAWPLWWRPAGLFALSYLLQGIGHRIEGNDMGEVVLIKRWLGRPYVVIAPRYDDDAEGCRGDSIPRPEGSTPSPSGSTVSPFKEER